MTSVTGCGTQLDHGVLAVGYGTYDGEEFILVKNQWTTDWGVNGYIRISADAAANNGAGVNGIFMYPSYPTT